MTDQRRIAADLLASPLEDLLEEARRVRNRRYGTRVTFSPKVFIPLTMLCQDRCGYCTFAKPPARLAERLPEHRARSSPSPGPAPRPAATRRCSPSGSARSCAIPAAAAWLAEHGFASTVDYLAECCRLVGSETGLARRTPTPGRSSQTSSPSCATVTVSQGMMLESLAEALACHRNSPDKTPARRLATLEAAGRLEDRLHDRASSSASARPAHDRLAALRAIAASHARHGHVQEVIVQNFLPKPRHRHARRAARARPRSTSGRSPPPGSCSRPRSTCRRRRT